MYYDYCAFKDSEAVLNFSVELRLQAHSTSELADEFKAKADCMNGDTSPYAAQVRTSAYHYARQASFLDNLEQLFLDSLNDETRETVDNYFEKHFTQYARKKAC